MGSPSSSLATLRPDLADGFLEFDLAMDRQGFIGHRVLPVFEAGRSAGTFGKISIESLLQARTTKRAPGTGYNRGHWEFTPETYATEENGLEEPIDDNEAKMYAEYFDIEQVSAQRALDGVMREAEKRAAAAIFDATTWTGAALTTAATNEWDDPTNATPLIDVEAAVQLVWDNSGLWPNALVINRKVFRNLRNVDEIIDRVKYSGFVDTRAGNITAEALAQAFDLDFVIVAGSAKNTADEAQTAVISGTWSDEYAMICRIATGNDLREPCIGRTFHWGEDGSVIGGAAETYRDENIRSDVVRVRHQTHEKRLYTEMGHLLSNITA